MGHLPGRIDLVAAASGPVQTFFKQSRWSDRHSAPQACDFAFGNPQEMPLPGLVGALQRHLEPRNKDWFAYKGSEPEPRRVVAQSLRDKLNLPFEPEDIALTNGGFSAIVCALHLVCEAGDEVVFSIPPWFNYEPICLMADLVPRKVPLAVPSFDLDLDAIAEMIGPRTRVVVVNSPHNPTGRVYPPEMLERLAALLSEASDRHGRPIWILSDEPYRELVFSGSAFTSPASAYPWTLIAYSYAKKLLAPGQRIGYLAVAPDCQTRSEVRDRFHDVQMACGWQFPNALMQYAISELEALSIDVAALERRRDRMISSLMGADYKLTQPEGTFYLLPESPSADDRAFSDWLGDRDVFVLPGTMFELPGYFRIALTASDEMVERSLPIFAEAMTVFGSNGRSR